MYDIMKLYILTEISVKPRINSTLTVLSIVERFSQTRGSFSQPQLN